MADRRSLIGTNVDFDAEGRRTGYLHVPHSVHRSAYGRILIPVVAAKNGAGPTVLLTGGVHGDEHEGPIALYDLIAKPRINQLSSSKRTEMRR